MSGRDERAGEAAGAAQHAAAGDGAHGLAYEQARLAYSIIQTLLEHTRVTQDLVALMAQVIDEDTQRALTETPHWSAYMDSRRAMERARGEIEQFAAEWTRMAREETPPAPADPPTTHE